jgi:uncharacterized protein involved in exopolysaccharide biosynthesis
MNDEIDLREFARPLARRWPWIVALAVVAGVAAAAVGILRPAEYRATVTIEATVPRYLWRFDTDIQTIVDTKADPRDMMIASAKSPSLLQALSESLGGAPSAEALHGMGNTRRGTGVLLYLDVESADAQQSARIADRWATLMVADADHVSKDLAALSEEYSGAQVALADAEAILLGFRQQTGQLDLTPALAAGSEDGELYAVATLDQQRLVLKNNVLAQSQEALDTLHTVAAWIDDRDSLAGAPLNLLDDLAESGLVQVASKDLLETGDAAGAVALLEREQERLSSLVQDLEADASQLLVQLASETLQQDVLVRERLVALERVNRLRRKVDELQMQQRLDDVGIRIVQEAEVPDAPEGASVWLSALAAVVAGLLLGAVVAIGWEALRRWRPPPQS